MKKALIIAAMAIGLIVSPALAQDVDIEGSVQGDGFARAGRCVVTPLAIYVVNADDTQGRVHIRCHEASYTRIVQVYQVEVMPDGTRRRFQTTQFDFGGTKSPNKDVVTAINTSCGPGTGRYSLDVQVYRKGHYPGDVEQWTSSFTLPVTGCI